MKIYVGLRRPLCVCNANQPAFLKEALPGRLGGRRGRYAGGKGEKQLRKGEEMQTQQG